MTSSEPLASRGRSRRLSGATLQSISGAVVPTYDRSAPPAIVHLGVGAFARGHLAVYADDLWRSGHPSAIHGVSLRSDRAERLLGPQDGLYTVLEREPDGAAPPRIIGALTRVETGSDAAITAIAVPSVRMVTLTITETGYSSPPESGLATPAVRALVEGLGARRRVGLDAPIVASLDNLAANGTVLRAAVLAATEVDDPDLTRWIAQDVAFPSSVVDRIVPATSPADRAEVDELLGVIDDAPVVAESYRSWVIEAADGLLPLEQVGVEVVADTRPYEIRKLWLLNGPHSALAYLGLLAGCDTISEAVRHPVVRRFVHRFVDDVCAVAPGPDVRAAADTSLKRFANPALGHTCAQVATDGSRKLPQRIIPPAELRVAAGLGIENLALVIAAWLAQVDVLEDPERERILRCVTDAERIEVALGDVDGVVRSEVATQLARIRADGLAAIGGSR